MPRSPAGGGKIRGVIATSPPAPAGRPVALDLTHAATMDPADVLGALGSTSAGLISAEAATRLTTFGPNAIRSHGARPLAVLIRQVKSPLLAILMAAVVISLFVGDRASAVIILVIVAISTGLGFINEFRSEQAVEALHSHIRQSSSSARGGCRFGSRSRASRSC
jgi:Mg2+-importing ATPase